MLSAREIQENDINLLVNFWLSEDNVFLEGMVGFAFVKKYITIPGKLNFEQPVNRWELSYDSFKSMK
jgi:hypothetical protein